MSKNIDQLKWCLERLAQAQGGKIDQLRLQVSLLEIESVAEYKNAVGILCAKMGYPSPQWLKFPDSAYLPLLAYTTQYGWLLITRETADGFWLSLDGNNTYKLSKHDLMNLSAAVQIKQIRVSFGIGALFGKKEEGFIGYIYQTLRIYRNDIIESGLATIFIGALALATSIFSMQVYDRVIPTKSEHTLWILASGVLLTIFLEFLMKLARAKLMDHVIVGMDNRLSREIFTRLLQLRVDQLPASVGSLAGQIRAYEQVRGFYTASTLFTLIDIPLGIVFLLVILLISHLFVAAVPLVFGLVALFVGLSIRKKILQQAQEGANFSNMKTGLLVEAVEGIETIKAGSGGWKFLSRWIDVNHQNIRNDLKMRGLNESVGYISASLQQVSYATMVVAGAWVVMQGQMTMGALIACSILSGRILAPIMALPGLLVQHAHAKAALEGLERLYLLKMDNHDVDQVLTPEKIKGQYELIDASFVYADNPPALIIPELKINPGERIAVLGPIGAGKSTLLRLLSGLYHPASGRILLDGLDLANIHRQVINDHIGYLQQEHRLFQGTLRENLLIGLPDPGDDAILYAMQRTGMDKFVAMHPKGLDRKIMEGGKGLSGGQKQLVAFTRVILTEPDVMLLDEPTATMDEDQERNCLNVLSQEASEGKTMVIVTHKPSILPLVTRIIVIANSKIMLDGPRDQVLQEIQRRNHAKHTGVDPAVVNNNSENSMPQSLT